MGIESVETGRARLRKHVVTENVTPTVPVSHEEVRIQREPITDARPLDTQTVTEQQQVDAEVAQEEIEQVQCDVGTTDGSTSNR